MERESFDLPEGFWLGTSLSAHQAEGGNFNTWTRWEELPGKIKNRDQSGDACRHWELFEDDFELLRWIGANTHRLSLEWSRLEPQPGQWSNEAIHRYRQMFESLRAKGIRPIACLFHFTLPIWFEDAGGFENEKGIEEFLKFVSRCQKEFGDLVSIWLTMNEPVVYALAAFGAGLTPPGKKDISLALQVVSNLFEAHGRAFAILKNANPSYQISLAHHMRILSPERRFWPLDFLFVKKADAIFNWSLLHFLNTGEVHFQVPGICDLKRRVPEAVGALDFLGINYYGRDYLSFTPLSEEKIKLNQTPNHLDVKTDMGWEIHPQGVDKILHGIKRYGFEKIPLVMTENGIADHDDDLRSQFIYEHFSNFLIGCKKYGLNAKGYLHWSLLDNFEWIDGFYPRFGLFEVDYKTQKRLPRKSAHYFRGIAEKKCVFKPIPG